MKADLLILGVLHRGDFHPYEIKRRLLAAQVECYIEVDVGTLYYAIRQLVKEQLIEVRGQEKVGNSPERTVYGITEAGRAHFQKLLLERFSDPSPVAHPLYPPLLFLHLADLPQVLKILRERLARMEEGIQVFRQFRTHMGTKIGTGPRFLMDHIERHKQTEREWLLSLIAEIEAGNVIDVRPEEVWNVQDFKCPR
ncbi:MAG: PadR family transcriptional regulator [Blastocatellia bacterium]|nr:PadR family transcriptional regulator [Blastocatellia bacterium]